MTEVLTEWLRLMLDEVARKRLESERAEAERNRRTDEAAGREPVPHRAAGPDEVATEP